MVLWEFIVICGIIFVLLELFIPSMFFLNFAFAAFITAGVSFFTAKMSVLVSVFFVFSFLSFIFLRPLLLKRKSKETETGISDKYIGKRVKVIEEVSSDNGAISIYDERWSARSEDGSVIPAGTEVEIVRNDSLVMYVKKYE
jgi:membrane protein implicated in regulation of membrane protease activity